MDDTMSSTPHSGLDQIRDYLQVTDLLGTAAQPTAAQFSTIHEAGFKAVINLALATSDNALPDEGAIVTPLTHGLSDKDAAVPFHIRAKPRQTGPRCPGRLARPAERLE